MPKVLGLALITVMLFGFTSCTEQGQSGGNVATNTNSTTPPAATTPANATPATTPLPTAATPTPSPAAPSTASVKNIGATSWEDGASKTPVTTIKVGGTVTWTVTGNHSLERVTGNAANGCDQLDDMFDTDFEPGKPVTKTFNKVGIFGYRCGVHGGNPNCKNPPGGGGMPGVINVVP